MHIDASDISEIDTFTIWDFEKVSNLVDPSIDFKQTFLTSDDVPIYQTTETQIFPTKISPLQTITNSSPLLNRKLFQSLSPSSQKLLEEIQYFAPIVKANPSITTNSSSCFCNFPPFSPISVSKRFKGQKNCPSLCKVETPDSTGSLSADGNQRIKRRKMNRESVQETVQNPEENENLTLDCVTPKTAFRRWTNEEDELLATAVESQRLPPNWNQIASKFFAGSRTGSQCKSHWNKRHSTNFTIRGDWQPEEDEQIMEMRSEGFTFAEIASQFPCRSTDQVRDRYKDNLDPGLAKTPWTEAEDSILVEEQRRLGNKWTQIAEKLPGRSTNKVKNRWYQKYHQEPSAEKCIESVQSMRNQEPGPSEQIETKTKSSTGKRKRKREDTLQPKRVFTRWTKSEDSILILEQGRIGNKWQEISQLLPGRSNEECRLRWLQLTPWTAAEDNILIQEHRRLGNQWTQIAQVLPGRSASQIRRRFVKELLQPRDEKPEPTQVAV